MDLVVYGCMLSCSGWTRFLQGLHFDQRLEFEEGDVGLAGGNFWS